jgi:hypothetical protein
MHLSTFATTASLSLVQRLGALQSCKTGYALQSRDQTTWVESSHNATAQDLFPIRFVQHSDGHNHFCQAANSPNPTNDTEQQNIDPDYLPSGYYDALGKPISEEEYFRQVDYEQQHGIPYARDREREKADTKKPLSLLAHPETGCSGDILARITESGTCYRDVQGSSIFVNSLPSDCEVMSFKDGSCEEDAFDMIPVLSDASGCYNTDAFSSIRVDCRPLPA